MYTFDDALASILAHLATKIPRLIVEESDLPNLASLAIMDPIAKMQIFVANIQIFGATLTIYDSRYRHMHQVDLSDPTSIECLEQIIDELSVL